MKKRLGYLSIFCFLLMAVSCNSPFLQPNSPVNDISLQTDLPHLKALAYMGGSVYYDPSNPGNSPVAKGVQIAFRLGHVDREIIDDEHAVFKDKPKEAVFGIVEVTDVGKENIAFLYDFYDGKGSVVGSGLRDISLGSSIDVDGDGVLDLSYQKPSVARPGLESALYLNFLSSKEELNTTMFSLIPEQYARGLYPNGVMGINPEGKFIVSKYQGSGSGRSLISGIAYGDYVLDNKTGKYERVVSRSLGTSSRSLSDGDLETMESPPVVTYRFQIQEFSDSMKAQTLLEAIPLQVRGGASGGLGEEASIAQLNGLLERSDLVDEFSKIQVGPIPEEYMGEVLASIPTLAQEQLIQLNRLFIEKSYPLLCPVVVVPDNPLSEIFPLLSCLIQNPEVDASGDASADSTGSRSVGMAVSSSDYDAQKKLIDDKWVPYKKVLIMKDFKILDSVKEFFSSGTGDSSGSGSGSVNPDGSMTVKLSPFKQFFVTTWDKIKSAVYTAPADVPESSLPQLVTTGPDGVLTLKDDKPTSSVTGPTNGGIGMEVGLYGYFTCTWGNIEGGAGVGLYIHADTNITVTAGYNTSNPTASGIIGASALPATISLKLFDAPPIQIGVVSIKVALNGGVSLPVAFNCSAEMSTGSRLAFTGLYGAQAFVGANYGVQWKSVKIGWWNFYYPSATWAWYGHGGLLNETAYYAGPTDWVVMKSMPGLEKSSASLSFIPTIFLEPRVLFNDVLWIGFRASASEELSLALTSQNVANQWYPDIHCVGSAQFKAGLSVTGGFSIVIPFVNYRWEPYLSIPVYDFGPFTKYTWNAF